MASVNQAGTPFNAVFHPPYEGFQYGSTYITDKHTALLFFLSWLATLGVKRRLFPEGP